MFSDFRFNAEYVQNMLWNYVFLNKGLSIYFNGDKFVSENGLRDLLERYISVEKLYDVKVVDVRTMVRKGKPRRSRFKIAKTSDWKRAIVVLDENSRIELF